MNDWTLVAFDDVPPQAWRNGGGVTRELLAWPANDQWSVRLSVADITRDGPFSAFAGVDRWFAVLEGDGVMLGDPPQAVRRDGAAIHFAGETAPSCSLIAGATRDLNLMVQRDRAVGTLRRLPPSRAALAWHEAVQDIDHVHGVFSVGGGVLTLHDAPPLILPAMSLAWRAAKAVTSADYFLPARADTGSFEFCCAIIAQPGSTT